MRSKGGEESHFPVSKLKTETETEITETSLNKNCILYSVSIFPKTKLSTVNCQQEALRISDYRKYLTVSKIINHLRFSGKPEKTNSLTREIFPPRVAVKVVES